MSTLNEIDEVVNMFVSGKCPFELMHCNSSYPMKEEEANIRCIPMLKNRYSCNVGYSGHESSLLKVTIAAICFGATSVERHITLDRTMYGSDQSASLEPSGLKRLVRDIRVIESAIGDGKKSISDSEKKGRDYLASPYWYKK